MKFLVELLSELAVETVSPDSPRALLLLALLGGVGLCAAETWVLTSVAQPLYGPDWAFTTIICGIAFGSMGAMLSGLHVTREETDRLLAWAAMVMNGVAIALAALAATL
jgi:hypothetical protein